MTSAQEASTARLPKTCLLLSESLAGGVLRAGRSLQRRGWHVVLASEVADDPNAAFCDAHVVVDWTACDYEIASAVERAGYRPAAIVNRVESLIARHAALLEHFGLTNPSPGLVVLGDKASVRRAGDAAGVFTLRWMDGLPADLATTPPLRYPVVLKPAVASGASRDVILLHSRAEFEYAIAELAQRRGSERFLAEEFLPGDEFSVDGYVLDGEFTAVFVADKPDHDAVRLRDRGLRIAPPSIVPAEAVDRFVDQLNVLIAQLGVDRTWLHVEGRADDRGRVSLIEVNPRPGGGLYAAAIRHATGVEPLELSLSLALGDEVPQVGPRNGEIIAIVPVDANEIGTVRSRTRLADMLAVDGVIDAYIIDNYRVTSLARENFFAGVMVTGRDVSELRRRAADALSVLDYEVVAV